MRRRSVLVLRNSQGRNCCQYGKNNKTAQAKPGNWPGSQRHFRRLLESRFAGSRFAEAREGDYARCFHVFPGPREDRQNATATSIRIARSSVLRRTTLSKPVRRRNCFLTIRVRPGGCGFCKLQSQSRTDLDLIDFDQRFAWCAFKSARLVARKRFSEEEIWWRSGASRQGPF